MTLTGAPFGDFGVVAGEEDVGNFYALEFFGAGVLGEFYVLVVLLERFNFSAGFAAEYSGE